MKPSRFWAHINEAVDTCHLAIAGRIHEYCCPKVSAASQITANNQEEEDAGPTSSDLFKDTDLAVKELSTCTMDRKMWSVSNARGHRIVHITNTVETPSTPVGCIRLVYHQNVQSYRLQPLANTTWSE